MTERAIHGAALVGEAVLEAIRQAVREEIQTLLSQNGHGSKKSSEAPRPYLTIKEAAYLSTLGKSTIRLLIRKRQLKFQQVGGRIIIKRADLEKFMEAHSLNVITD